MKDWKISISNEVKNIIDIDFVADEYYQQIKKHVNRGFDESKAVRFARLDMIKVLSSKDIKRYDIIHLLHCCRVKIWPKKHEKCGCH